MTIQAPLSPSETVPALSHGSLQEEIQQSRPFHSPNQEAVLGLFRTTDIVRRQYMQLLREHDITLQQYNVLRILRGAGDQGLPTLTIAERMVEHAPGITRLIDRLERKGWVQRDRSAGDRRRVLCRITPAGLAILSEADTPIEHLDGECLGMLDEDEVRFLIKILDRVRLDSPD